VTDLAGAPLASRIVALCGRACYGTQSASDGSFVIDVGDFIARENYAIHADGRPDHAGVYLRLTKGDAEAIVLTSPLLLPALPASGPPLPPDGSPASEVTSGDVTFALQDGTNITLAFEDFSLDDLGRMLRTVSVPLDQAPDFAKAVSAEALYAIAPAEATASKKIALTIANAANLPAGAAIDVLVVGSDYVSSSPTVGIMSVVAAAHVSADGKTITTDPGEGITSINWLALRRRGT